MSVVRQDAWSQEEDLVLAEVILSHIREGKTQLQAFEEVGKRLGRTSAACGFRWNATIRKSYSKAIKMAKEKKNAVKTRREASLAVKQNHESKQPQPLGSMKDVILFLQEMDRSESASDQLQQELDRERSEKEALLSRLRNAEEQLASVQKDYQSFLSLLDKARSYPGR